MSWQPDVSFVEDYKNALELKFQQEGSRLRKTVDVVPQVGESQFFDRIDNLANTAVHAMTVRHGDTPLDDITHTRRRVQCVGYNHNLLFDNQDKLRMLVDPRNGYAQSQAYLLGRKMDLVIIDAASGTAYTGKTGSTATTFDTTNQRVAVDFTESGAAVTSNLTLGKLREARRKLLVNEAISDMEKIYFILSASQEMSLLRTTEATSSDYNTVKALVNGEINTFMGFTFVRTELLTEESGNVRVCLAYPQSAIKLAVAEELKVRIDERKDKNYSWQVYSEATFGAVRMWEEKVVEIRCDEDV